MGALSFLKTNYLEMKRILYFVVAAVAVMCVSSCKEKAKTVLQQENEFRATLSDQDTTQMLKLADDCMELLKNKDIEVALAMLMEYDDSANQVKPLSDETRKRYTHMFKMFPVLSYTRVEYTFMMEGLNNVKYDIIFAEEEHPEVNGVPKTSFMFNPVKIDDQWFLTVKRADQGIGRLE